MTVAATGQPIVKLLSTSTWRQGEKIASIASARLAASTSPDSVSSNTSAAARLSASVMSCVFPPGK